MRATLHMWLSLPMSKVAQKGNLLTTAQVSEMTGWSVAKVNRKAASGNLPVAFKVEGKRGLRLFDPVDVKAAIKSERAA